MPKSNKSSKKFSYKFFSSLFFTHSMFSFERQASLILFLQEVMSAEKEIEFQAAVRGFHYYRKYWKSKEGELLSCSHEFGNPFDVFAIKTCTDEGNIVGHLSLSLSREKSLERQNFFWIEGQL